MKQYIFRLNGLNNPDDPHKIVQKRHAKVLNAIKSLGIERRSIDVQTLAHSSEKEQKRLCRESFFYKVNMLMPRYIFSRVFRKICSFVKQYIRQLLSPVLIIY